MPLDTPTPEVDPWVTVILPLWRRPHRVAPVVEAFLVAAGPVMIVPVCSLDDQPTIDALVHAEKLHGQLPVHIAHWPGGSHGDYARKINAVARASTTPWIFTGADDLAPQPGWVEAALGDSPHGHTAGVVGTNDLFNPRVLKGEHSTHSLVARWYIDDPGGAWGEPGTVFHEGYPHEFCDDELVGVAKSRGRFRCAPEAIVEHLHPYAGKSPRDAVYDHGHREARDTQLLYLRRSRAWNPGGRTSNQLRRLR